MTSESSNYVTKIAIVGAGGNSGSFITQALLATGKHTVTAITRADRQSKLPEGVTIKRVDYDQHDTLVEALTGQDALVVTLGGMTPKETEPALIRAAADAGVPWILPNEWAPDTANEALVRDIFVLQPKITNRKLIEELGKSSYISVSTGFWYEWSLAIPPAFGFDSANRTVTFFDDGETKISVSTWPQIGRAVASLLSLPIMPIPSHSTSLTTLKNRVIYVSSFTLSQRDMFGSVLRVTNTSADSWTVKNEPSHERYNTGLREIKEGIRVGWAKMLYTRVFWPDGCGDVSGSEGNVSGVLGLEGEGEKLDEATEVAVKRAGWKSLQRNEVGQQGNG